MATAGTWSEDHARRLLWRAGFGGGPAEVALRARAGRAASIAALVEGPRGGARLVGPAPTADGRPLDPVNEWGDNTLWWLDRMVRTTHPLEEKLTLFWHDHFATAGQDTPLMLAQNRLFRRHALGGFPVLLRGVTRDPAMQLFLSLAGSTKEAPNENFARELLELFTLGGGYTERDVRETARALTGFRAVWGDGGLERIVFDRRLHDRGVKRILGHRGRFGPDAVLRLVVRHPRHAPFLTRKLWDFFVTDPPDRATARALARTYRASGLRIRPVVRRILEHPALYARLDAPDLVKCPVVHVAGALRTAGKGVDLAAYAWLLQQMGQEPFRPPSVAGWDWGAAWLSTGTMKAGLSFANQVVAWNDRAPFAVPDGSGDPALPPAAQVDRALAALGRPPLSPAARAVLTDVASDFFSDLVKPWQQGDAKRKRADMLQRLLRVLILSGPDAHLH